MKRFIEASDWREPWHRKLSPQAKNLRRFLWDNCDCAGVISLDFEAISFHVGEAIEEQHLAELGDWVEQMPNGRLLIPSFIHFQSGFLSADCRAHTSILKAIKAHNLTLSGESYHYSDRLSSKSTKSPHRHKLIEKEEDKEQVQDNSDSGTPTPAQEVLAFLNSQSGRNFRDTETNIGFIEARLAESGVDVAGIKTMVTRQCALWKGDRMAEFLRPETLFNKTKFDGYYAAKDLPVNEANPRNHAGGHRLSGAEQRSAGIPERPNQPDIGDLLERKAQRDATA